MKAELAYAGKRLDLSLPENTVFVNFYARWTVGNAENRHSIIGADVQTIEEMLGCKAVKIGSGVRRAACPGDPTDDRPVEFEIHAYVDQTGELVKLLKPYAGMTMLVDQTHGFCFTVTI